VLKVVRQLVVDRHVGGVVGASTGMMINQMIKQPNVS